MARTKQEARKIAKVYMLPTEIKGGQGHTLWTNESGQLLHTKTSSNHLQGQHLYFTTDEEIREGDWVYWEDPEGLTSDINQVISIDEEMIFLSHPEHSETEALPSECRKIIASDDPKLKIITGIVGSGTGVPLPQPSQAFIKAYCEQGGIDEVDVEYECLTSTHTTIVDYSKEPIETEALSEPKCIESRLKVDPIHNTITTHLIEEKMYSREEVEDLIHKFNMEQAGFPWALDDTLKWIKENL